MPSLAVLRRLEQTVRLAALVVGLVVAVALPTAYLVTGYLEENEHRAFQARLSAGRLSRNAYIQGPTWRFSVDRLAELIAFDRASNQHVRQRVYDAGGELLLTTGDTDPGPAIMRSAPIVLGKQVIGRVELEAGLRSLLVKLPFAVLAGAVLGFAAYFAAYHLPIRILRRTLAALEETQRELQRQVVETTRAYDELQRQHRVTEETAEELTRAMHRAELANRTKSEFLANMSHELRTPLNAIIGFSDIIMNERFGANHPAYQTYAGDIHSSGAHLLAVINDILDIAKIEAGKLVLQEERLDVSRIVDACRRLMAERAEAAGVKLVVDTPAGDVPDVHADPTKLKQILLNLMSNAVKFTPRNGTVTVSTQVAANERLCIAVQDTGIGMTAAEIQTALVPFRQVDNSHSRKYQGTGLGLPLAKGLIELHGGTLEIASTPGVGTTMRVLLPLRSARSAAA